MEKLDYKIQSLDETMLLGEKIGRLLEPNDIITLEGDLGAGKTTFTKGIANGLGVTRVVNSPTFTIIKEYKGRLPLYHMDVYRLEASEEDLGFEEYFEGGGVTVIEWPSMIKEQLPAQRLVITIHNEGEEKRSITLHPIGERYILLCKELEKV